MKIQNFKLLWFLLALTLILPPSLFAGPLFDEGKALYMQEEYKKAAKVFKKSLKDEAENDESATLLLSQCYSNLNKNYKAVSVLKEGAKRHTDSWVIFYRLGNLQEDAGDLFAALAAFSQASILKPDDPMTTFRLGLAYDETAQIEKALEVYRRLHRAGSPLAPKLLNAIQGMD